MSSGNPHLTLGDYIRPGELFAMARGPSTREILMRSNCGPSKDQFGLRMVSVYDWEGRIGALPYDTEVYRVSAEVIK